MHTKNIMYLKQCSDAYMYKHASNACYIIRVCMIFTISRNACLGSVKLKMQIMMLQSFPYKIINIISLFGPIVIFLTREITLIG